MEVAQSSLGARTRARARAFQRHQKSPPNAAAASTAASGGSYLQLRSRRIEKPPIDARKTPKRQKQENKNADLGGGGGAVEASQDREKNEDELYDAMSGKQACIGVYRYMLKTGNLKHQININIRRCNSYEDFSRVLNLAWADISNVEPSEEALPVEESWPDYHLYFEMNNPVTGKWQDMPLSVGWADFKGICQECEFALFNFQNMKTRGFFVFYSQH